jgi:hypothetical protein
MPAAHSRIRSLPLAMLAHYATLAAAVPVLFFIARGQWFFYDEWAFLVPDNGGLWASHNGHWSTIPILITDGLRALVGLNSYAPYYATILIAHLALVHVLWRLMLRVGANTWIATCLAFVMAFLGAGSENILWEFQIGFVGAVAFALGALLIVLRDDVKLRGWIAIAALILLGLASSGTSLPVAVVAGLVSWRRHGLRSTALAFGPPAVIYLIWYRLEAVGAVNTFQAQTLDDFLVGIPRFVGWMYTDGLASITPIAAIGTAITIGLVFWIVATARRALTREGLAPYAIFLAGVGFALLTAYSRLTLGRETTSSSRYVYLIFALSLPLIAIAATYFSRRRKEVLALTSILLVGIGVYNTGLLISGARNEAIREQGTRGQIYAALDLALEEPDLVTSASHPDTMWAPNLTTQDLVDMYDNGWISVGPYTKVEELGARAELALPIVLTTAPGTCSPVGGDAAGISSGNSVILNFPAADDLDILAYDAETTGAVRKAHVEAGAYSFTNTTGYEVRIGSLSADVGVCNE